METVDLYCSVGTCLCTDFEEQPTSVECGRCGHPLEAHRPNDDE